LNALKVKFWILSKKKLKMTKNIYIFGFFEKISKLSYDKCHLFTIFTVWSLVRDLKSKFVKKRKGVKAFPR